MIRAAVLILTMAACHAPASAQAAGQWTSEDGVLGVTPPAGWVRETANIPAVKLMAVSPDKEQSGACTVAVNRLRGRTQEASNTFAQTFMRSQAAGGSLVETRAGDVLVVSSSKAEKDGGQEITRFFVTSSVEYSTGYTIQCLASVDRMADAQAFAASLTIRGEAPK